MNRVLVNDMVSGMVVGYREWCGKQKNDGMDGNAFLMRGLEEDGQDFFELTGRLLYSNSLQPC